MLSTSTRTRSCAPTYAYSGRRPTPHMVHSHAVHLPRGALLSPRTVWRHRSSPLPLPHLPHRSSASTLPPHAAVAAVPRAEAHFTYGRYKRLCGERFAARYPSIRGGLNASLGTFNAGVLLLDLRAWEAFNLTGEAEWWLAGPHMAHCTRRAPCTRCTAHPVRHVVQVARAAPPIGRGAVAPGLPARAAPRAVRQATDPITTEYSHKPKPEPDPSLGDETSAQAQA